MRRAIVTRWTCSLHRRCYSICVCPTPVQPHRHSPTIHNNIRAYVNRVRPIYFLYSTLSGSYCRPLKGIVTYICENCLLYDTDTCYISSRKLAAFTVLCEQYQPSIKRDPCYVQYLDKIGQIFFGVKPPQRQNGGFLGNFIQNFLGGLDDDSDDDIQPPLPPTAARASTSQPMESSELD